MCNAYFRWLRNKVKIKTIVSIAALWLCCDTNAVVYGWEISNGLNRRWLKMIIWNANFYCYVVRTQINIWLRLPLRYDFEVNFIENKFNHMLDKLTSTQKTHTQNKMRFSPSNDKSLVRTIVCIFVRLIENLCQMTWSIISKMSSVSLNHIVESSICLDISERIIIFKRYEN